jgi:hypothetical protein
MQNGELRDGSQVLRCGTTATNAAETRVPRRRDSPADGTGRDVDRRVAGVEPASVDAAGPLPARRASEWHYPT